MRAIVARLVAFPEEGGFVAAAGEVRSRQFAETLSLPPANQAISPVWKFSVWVVWKGFCHLMRAFACSDQNPSGSAIDRL